MTKETTSQPNVYLFFGEDTYSSNQKVKFWKEQFIKKYGEESNIEIIDGKSLEPSKFISNIETLPFLSDKRMVIVTNYLSKANRDEQKIISDAIEKAPDFCVVVFHETENPDKVGSLYKRIKKVGKLEEFTPQTPAQLANWIQKKCKTIDISTANYLALHCGNELWRISTELEKLEVYAAQSPITKKMIDELVTPSLSASIFKLTDSISSRRPNESLKTLETLKETGEELTRVFFMIVRHFRILIQVHEMAGKNENQFSITKKLKQHPFVIQKTLQQSKNFTAEKLEEIYEKLLEIDVKFKTGVIKTYQQDDSEYKLAIEKLIIECCQ
ncbi:MAG: DNA polymerase III subunit delta [Nitrospirota bacterium]